MGPERAHRAGLRAGCPCRRSRQRGGVIVGAGDTVSDGRRLAWRGRRPPFHILRATSATKADRPEAYRNPSATEAGCHGRRHHGWLPPRAGRAGHVGALVSWIEDVVPVRCSSPERGWASPTPIGVTGRGPAAAAGAASTPFLLERFLEATVAAVLWSGARLRNFRSTTEAIPGGGYVDATDALFVPWMTRGQPPSPCEGDRAPRAVGSGDLGRRVSSAGSSAGCRRE